MTLFIELLQVSMGTRNTLSRVPTVAEWEALFVEAQQQAVLGIMTSGIERLPQEQQPSKVLLLQWVGLTLQIEQHNSITTKSCKEIIEQFKKDGFNVCVLKGQANHRYYPREMQCRRSCGDVDIWVSPVKGEGVNGNSNLVRLVLEYVDAHWERTGLCWLHCNFNHESGVPVEIHFHPSFMNEPIRNSLFLKMFSDFDDCICQKEIDENVLIPVMKPEYDILFQMNHIYRHLIDEGVGLRQIVDYYMLLGSVHDSGLMTQDFKEERMRVIEQLGMKRFAEALMYVLREILAMPEEYMLCSASEKDGKFLMNEIMMAGNFGHSDPRLGTLSSQGVLSRQISQAKRRFIRNMRFLTSYPGEVIWEPFARMWHFAWKKFGLWRF